jgi:hypothetical protein
VKTFVGREGFRFLDEREMRLTSRWFHYSPTETFSELFRSPDWFLWREHRFTEALQVMATAGANPDHETSRERRWAASGVRAVRLQVVDAESVADIASPLNYLLTYLHVTHPGEQRLLLDGDAASAAGAALPDVDFILHDDDLAITKYLAVPTHPPATPATPAAAATAGAGVVVHRDAYFNRPPTPQDPDDDRPVYRRYAALADAVLSSASDLTYRGPLPGVALLDT